MCKIAFVAFRTAGAAVCSVVSQPGRCRLQYQASGNERGSCRRHSWAQGARSASPSSRVGVAELLGNNTYWHTAHGERRAMSVPTWNEIADLIFARVRASSRGRNWRCQFWADFTTNTSEHRFPTGTPGALLLVGARIKGFFGPHNDGCFRRGFLAIFFVRIFYSA
jgi:hypothetical protein